MIDTLRFFIQHPDARREVGAAARALARGRTMAASLAAALDVTGLDPAPLEWNV